MIRWPLRGPEDVAGAAAAAARVVAAGGVVLIPTESYYGLGADPRNALAVARVLELKGRPDDLGLPVVCSDWDQVESLVTIPDGLRVKLSRMWPAALTVVAPSRGAVAAGRDGTLAIRIPDSDLLRAVLYRVGPLTATSANRHGAEPSAEVDGALASLDGEPELVLDGGRLAGGPVSTLVDLGVAGGRVIRHGAVDWQPRWGDENWFIQGR